MGYAHAVPAATFNRCEWKFRGFKIGRLGTLEEVDNDWQHAGNWYECFRHDETNQVRWVRLLITARAVPAGGSGLQECAICLGDSLLSPSSTHAITTPCGHRFHRECLRPPAPAAVLTSAPLPLAASWLQQRCCVGWVSGTRHHRQRDQCNVLLWNAAFSGTVAVVMRLDSCCIEHEHVTHSGLQHALSPRQRLLSRLAARQAKAA